MSLLPFNASALERALDKAAGLNIDVSAITALWNPWTCQEDALPWLAWAMHITDDEGWRLATTTEQRRALISRSVELHRKKGTPWSIREAFKALGFNDLEISESLPSNRYDGSLSYSGSDVYAAYGWAQFRITAVASDEQPINADQTELIVRTVNAWKPARSHLVDVQHAATDVEYVDVDDDFEFGVEATHTDSHHWGHRFYDGTLAYDNGFTANFDGTLRYDGSALMVGFATIPGGATFDGDREATSMAGTLGFADRQQRFRPFEGAVRYDGTADYGASAPVAEDLPMPIIVQRHRRYDGRMAYSAHRYDGSARYAGSFTYFGNSAYSGDSFTALEA